MKELGTTSDGKNDVDITNDNIESVTIKYYTMTTTKERQDLYKGSSDY